MDSSHRPAILARARHSSVLLHALLGSAMAAACTMGSPASPPGNVDGSPTPGDLDASKPDSRPPDQDAEVRESGTAGTYEEKELSVVLALSFVATGTADASPGSGVDGGPNASADAEAETGSDASLTGAGLETGNGVDAQLADATPPSDALPVDATMDKGGSVEDATTLDDAASTDAAADPEGDLQQDILDAGAPRVATLTITARDGTTPVITDLWLYTLDDSGLMTPLAGFTSTAARKSPRRMLPATIGGQTSGLAPADEGDENGLMTNLTRGVLEQGAFVSAINGTAVVTLASAPTSPILVVAGVEDQRYSGAAVVNPDGTPGIVPPGVGAPETHTQRSFTTDVAPILQRVCSSCHNPGGPNNAGLYLVTGSRNDLVNDNFAVKEQTLKCQTNNPDGGTALVACIQSITQAQYLIEPGAPAVSDLLQRARPDEDAGTSTLGLAWYGSRGSRYSTTYGDRRMPSTALSTNSADWTNAPSYFDMHPDEYQVIWDWVAQGALP